jgi:predicted ATP-grasp superfamily ATP-dependent carboligase
MLGNARGMARSLLLKCGSDGLDAISIYAEVSPQRAEEGPRLRGSDPGAVKRVSEAAF